MRLLPKVINGNLYGHRIFSLAEHPGFLFTYQAVRKWFGLSRELHGFFIECYESKPDGKRVGYLYASFRPKTLAIDTKGFVFRSSFLFKYLKETGIKINYRQRRIIDSYALKILDEYSFENKLRSESKKGFGKLLVKMAIELGLYQHRLEFLCVSYLDTSYPFYKKILRIKDRYLVAPLNAWLGSALEMSLKKAWRNINWKISGAGVPKGEP
jgi:hypothetical protein